MRIIVNKHEIKGKVQAPSSKSYTIRGLMCAALAKGESRIINPLSSDDTEAASGVLGKIGVRTLMESSRWLVDGGNFHSPKEDLYCGESAATLRFMMAICSLVPGTCRLTAGPSLSKRPVITLVEAIKKWGVDVSCRGDYAPVVVKGGKLEGGTTELPGDISSQYVSALLLVAPLAEKSVTIRLTTQLESRPYVSMTLECLRKFGIDIKSSEDLKEYAANPQIYQASEYRVEGDWSSASYLLALGAAAGEVQVSNLDIRSLQGDKAIAAYLKEMGALVEINQDTITVRRNQLKAIKADLNNCIDLLPTMAVLAALADGTSEYTGIERAKLKESNRISSVIEGLVKAGIRVIEEPDKLIITGGKPQKAIIDSKNDHRIAMAFSIIGAATGDITIDGAECVSKTYPEYWDTLRILGVNLDEQ